MQEQIPHLMTSAVVLDLDARHTLLVRDDPRGRWHLVTGHVEGGETLSESARREVREQTGLTRVRVVEPHLAVQQDRYECRGGEARHIDHVFAVLLDPADLVSDGPLDGDAGLVAWFRTGDLPEPIAPGVRLHVSSAVRLSST